MTESQGRIIRKRNPGMLQPDEEVTAQFVVREHELSTVLEILRGNVEADSCQHTLIVAPRGRGKTMLLARIAAELRADAELASCLLPVRFMEESDEVFSAADFWLEALFYLALAIDKPAPSSHGACGTRGRTSPPGGASGSSTNALGPPCWRRRIRSECASS